MSRPASAWTGAAARSQLRMLRLVWQVLHGHARAQADQVALHRIEADRFRSFRAQGLGARRVRPEGEQRMRVLVGATGPSARGTGEPSMLLLCEPRCRPPARSYPA